MMRINLIHHKPLWGRRRRFQIQIVKTYQKLMLDTSSSKDASCRMGQSIIIQFLNINAVLLYSACEYALTDFREPAVAH